MSEIIIKKRVSLDFLGEDYADSFLVFKSISIKEYEELQNLVKTYENDNEKSFAFIKEQLESRFIEGKVKQGEVMVDISSEQLADLPAEVYINAFSTITGVISPKA